MSVINLSQIIPIMSQKVEYHPIKIIVAYASLYKDNQFKNF